VALIDNLGTISYLLSIKTVLYSTMSQIMHLWYSILLLSGFIANWKDRIQGLFKDLKLQFSSTKSIDKKTYHTRAVITIT